MRLFAIVLAGGALALGVSGCGAPLDADVPLLYVAPNAGARAAWLERFMNRDPSGRPLPPQDPLPKDADGDDGQEEPAPSVDTK